MVFRKMYWYVFGPRKCRVCIKQARREIREREGVVCIVTVRSFVETKGFHPHFHLRFVSVY